MHLKMSENQSFSRKWTCGWTHLTSLFEVKFADLTTAGPTSATRKENDFKQFWMESLVFEDCLEDTVQSSMTLIGLTQTDTSWTYPTKEQLSLLTITIGPLRKWEKFRSFAPWEKMQLALLKTLEEEEVPAKRRLKRIWASKLWEQEWSHHLDFFTIDFLFWTRNSTNLKSN